MKSTPPPPSPDQVLPVTGAARVWAAIRAAVLAEHAHLYKELRLSSPGAGLADFGADLGRQYQLQLAALFAGRSRLASNIPDRELLRFSVSPEEAFSEQLQLTAIERRAEAHHAESYRRWSECLRARVPSHEEFKASTLSPAAPLRAFRAALETLGLQSAGRLSLYEAFERSVIDGLGRVYEVALAALESGGWSADRDQRPASPPLLNIDPEWRQSMLSIRDDSGLAFERDRRLATDLLAVLDQGSSAALNQRLGLCGLLLRPVLMASGRPAAVFLRLRWSLLKIALADEAVFDRPSHPLRLALRDLAAGSGSAEISRRLQQLEISADFIAPLLPRLSLLSNELIDRLNEQLQAQEQGLRDQCLSAARRVVASTMDRCSLGMPRPAGLRLFLRAGWGPLLTQQYLQKGFDSEEWRAGVLQLQQLLNLLADTSTRVREFEPQVIQAGARLFAEGVHADRVERLQQALREAYDELHIGATDPVAQALDSADERFHPGDGFIEFESGASPPITAGASKMMAPPSPSDPDPGGLPDLELFRV